jgi:hypothetical protein
MMLIVNEEAAVGGHGRPRKRSVWMEKGKAEGQIRAAE